MKPSGAVQGLVNSDDPRLVAALEEYMAQAEAGRAPERESFLRLHPELERELAGCLDALEALAGPGQEVRKTLGDFRILREVGRGGMGVVYEAEQISLGRRVALKVLPTAATMDGRAMQRFQNEARAAASLQHEHIVPVYAVGSEGDTHFYAMQFIEGRSLAGMASTQAGGADTGPATPATPSHAVAAQPGGPALAAARLTFGQAARWGAEAAEALEYAHSMGVVHRDVKPGNLLIDDQGKLWVGDFGLARVAGDGSLTGTGDVVGTLRYMSPEQARAQHGLVDHRADVYSLGATLYEMLAGRPAFPSDDAADVLARVVSDEPAPLRRLNAAIPADLETVVMKAMEKAPEDRYATAREMAEDLRRFLADEPIRAKPPGPGQRLRRWLKRNWVAASWAAVVLLLLSLFIWANVAWWAQRQARAEAGPRAALVELGLLQRQEKWEEAKAVIRRALAAPDVHLVDATLRHELEEWERDIEMALLLQEAALRAAARDGTFNEPVTAEAYADAFRWYDLNVVQPSPEDIAEQIRGRPIRPQLVAALYDWARIDAHVRHHLLSVCRLADPGPQRDRLSDVLKGKGRVAAKDLVGALARGVPDPITVEALLALVEWEAKEVGTVNEEAITALSQACQRRADDFWLNVRMGRLYSWDPNAREEAVRHFSIAVALRPRSPSARIALGFALAAKGDWEEAIEAHRQAIHLNPGIAEAHYGLGHPLTEQGKLDEAIVALQQAIRLKPGHARAHTNLGIALHRKGNSKDAMACYRRAIHLNPRLAQARVALGNVYLRNGEVDAALKPYRDALQINPCYDLAHTGLGTALAKKGQLDEAIKEHRLAIRYAAHRAEAHAGMGDTLRLMGKPVEAIASYRKAISLNPRLVEPHIAFGYLMLEKGRIDVAIKAFRDAVRLKTDNVEVYVNLGALLLRQGGDLSEAISLFRRAIGLRPESAAAHCNLGHALINNGRFAEALKSLRRGHLLASGQPGWSHPSAAWIKDAERLVALEARLPCLLTGADKPAAPAEAVEIASMCCKLRRHAVACRFYEAAFKADARLAQGLNQHRYDAACAAALAGGGKKEGAATAREASRWRHQSRAWLSNELQTWREAVTRGTAASTQASGVLKHWLTDRDLASVRGEAALAKLPPEEAAEWRHLWKEVDELRRQAEAASAPRRDTKGPG